MLYHDSRPLTRQPHKNSPQRRFEWRDFIQEGQNQVQDIRDRFEFDKEETCVDRFFLLPGRRNQISRLNQNDTFFINTLVEESGPLELWETTVESKVPMKRTLAQKIAALIPKFSGPVIGSMTPDELSESLQRKTRFYEVQTTREIFKRGDVTAKVSRAQIGETQVLSIAFESPDAEPLLSELKALGLRRRENTNYGTYLLGQA